jgi:hypothetical protein
MDQLAQPHAPTGQPFQRSLQGSAFFWIGRDPSFPVATFCHSCGKAHRAEKGIRFPRRTMRCSRTRASDSIPRVVPTFGSDAQEAEWSFVFETYHIETMEPEAEGGRVIQRTSVRSNSFEAVKERALRTFQRSQLPQARDDVEAVRVLNGAGHEVFSISIRD